MYNDLSEIDGMGVIPSQENNFLVETEKMSSTELTRRLLTEKNDKIVKTLREMLGKK